MDNYEQQEQAIQQVLVVDNGSTDGTAEFLDAWAQKSGLFQRTVIRTHSNLGGSGGFNIALQEIGKRNCDWVYVADDDAFPTKDFFSEARRLLSSNPESTSWAALLAGVYSRGRPSLKHRRRCTLVGTRVQDVVVPADEYTASSFSVNVFSFVGSFLNQKLLQSSGLLPDAEFFIWYDDTDFSLSFSQLGVVRCFPQLVVNHQEADRGTFSWKRFYQARNRLLMYKKNFGYWVFFSSFRKELVRVMIKTLRACVRCSRLDLQKQRVIFSALMASLWGKKGRHPLYGPGWSLKK